MNETLLGAMDAYIEEHNHSEAAMETVRQVLNRYEHMVALARERALGELAVTSNIISFEEKRRELRPSFYTT